MKIVLMDMSYLFHRALHTTGDLEHDGEATGCLYGFFMELGQIKRRYPHHKLVAVFDHPYNKRKEKYPHYKAGRYDDMTEEEKEARVQMLNQLARLRDEILPEWGFVHILCEEGYECDDLIHVISSRCAEHDDIVIVSSDQDLYQCLKQNVSMYKPSTKKVYSYDNFVSEWGITPSRWAEVKAIAGDKSDNIKGVFRVGAKTAIKYLKGELKETSKAYLNIVENQSVIEGNAELVTLPWPGTPDVILSRRIPVLKYDYFVKICIECGFYSFLSSRKYWKELFNMRGEFKELSDDLTELVREDGIARLSAEAEEINNLGCHLLGD